MTTRFDPSPIIDAAVEAAAAATRHLPRGDVLTHEDLVCASGFAPYSTHWAQFIKRLKARVRDERGIELWPVVGIGYALATAEQQLIDIPRERSKRAGRQMRRGIRAVEAIPAEDLSHHQQVARAARLNAMREAERQLALKRKQMDAIFRPSDQQDAVA